MSETINNQEYNLELVDSLVGQDPADLLVTYGPTKRYVNNYHWHSPKVGIVASYSPTEKDVEGHFGVFRGVDQVESFAQATVGSCTLFLECKKLGLTPTGLSERFTPRFISIGHVAFHYYLAQGDTLINIGYIKFNKFRQMVCDGRIYKISKDLDLDEYFSSFNEERLLSYDLSPDFILVAELFDITARGIKNEVINKYLQQ